MSEHLCPYCGTPLKIVSNRWYCPNHGFIDEYNESGDDYPSYLG